MEVNLDPSLKNEEIDLNSSDSSGLKLMFYQHIKKMNLANNIM